jgi:hypothetical protein
MKIEQKKRGRPSKVTAESSLKQGKKAPRSDLPAETKDLLAEAYSKLTKGQLDFVYNFIQADFRNATECYCNAFPEATRESGASEASRLLTSLNVRAVIALELDMALGAAKTGLEKRIMDTWLVRAFYDVADIIDGDGRLAHSMQELKQLGLSIVIDGIDIKPDKDGGEHVVYKLADKDRALEMLQKYIQMIKQPDARVKGTGPDGQAFAFTVEFLKPEKE